MMGIIKEVHLPSRCLFPGNMTSGLTAIYGGKAGFMACLPASSLCESEKFTSHQRR
jgi:hypothetical protein